MSVPRAAPPRIVVRELSTPSPAELDRVCLLGRDVWGEGLSREAYLAECRASVKYARGRWHALLADEAIVAALIVYRRGFGLPPDACGIGSVATSPDHRGRGHAAMLLARVVDRLEAGGVRAAYLFADIDTSLYARCGFVPLGDEGDRRCRVRLAASGSGPDARPPDYF